MRALGSELQPGCRDNVAPLFLLARGPSRCAIARDSLSSLAREHFPVTTPTFPISQSQLPLSRSRLSSLPGACRQCFPILSPILRTHWCLHILAMEPMEAPSFHALQQHSKTPCMKCLRKGRKDSADGSVAPPDIFCRFDSKTSTSKCSLYVDRKDTGCSPVGFSF